ncbi:MAG: hypothetical protein KatS3mg061_2841 [Dehalococcoidia bacterium]|nr:MAG: hypothetical protein KatS3mg061_2841 [Dehalococcoidia bacterium]
MTLRFPARMVGSGRWVVPLALALATFLPPPGPCPAPDLEDHRRRWR